MSGGKPVLSGGLSGVTSLPQLIQLLRPYFLSSSLGQPPGAAASATGNRTVAITNKTQSAQATAPKQVTTQALVAGTLTWSFAAPGFNKPPVIEMAAVGTPPSAGTTLYISSVAANSVIIKSTDATDVRTLHLTATGNPN